MTGERRRLDQWLWFARFLKSRAAATRLCETGRIRVNGILTDKAHYGIKPGDVLTFALDASIHVVRITGVGERRGPVIEAQSLYEPLSERSVMTRFGADDGQRATPADGIAERPL